MNVHQNAAMNASSLHLLQASRCSITGGRALIVCLHWTGVTHTRKNLPHVGLFPEKQEKEAGLALQKGPSSPENLPTTHHSNIHDLRESARVEVKALISTKAEVYFFLKSMRLACFGFFFPEGKVSIE